MSIIKKVLTKIQNNGLGWFLSKIFYKIKAKSGFIKWQFKEAPVYSNPSNLDLADIEQALIDNKVKLVDYNPLLIGFESFKKQGWFSENYHGGSSFVAWNEKLLEHWIAYELLNLGNYGEHDIYVDIAAGASPWARELRTREKIKSFAIDLSPIPNEFKQLEYYRQENGTATRFADSSVRGVSLQCAFEMFSGNDDVALIGELSRILKKGGKAIIVPLYMHTSYRFYATPDFYGRNDNIQESDADVYIRYDIEGIPSSRKYSATKLCTRIISEIERNSMDYTLRVLRNKSELGPDIYCHFILEITK